MEESKNISSLGTDKHSVITEKAKVEELHHFKGLPFKVEHDMELFNLSKSIKENGVLVLLIVRKNPNGCGYEIISGHRRKAACEWAGITEIPIVVMELTDAEAVITMVDSNMQRENIKPSEKAFAYKMKLEAMKNQGKRSDLFMSQVGTKLKKDELGEGSMILRADERLAKKWAKAGIR